MAKRLSGRVRGWRRSARFARAVSPVVPVLRPFAWAADDLAVLSRGCLVPFRGRVRCALGHRFPVFGFAPWSFRLLLWRVWLALSGVCPLAAPARPRCGAAVSRACRSLSSARLRCPACFAPLPPGRLAAWLELGAVFPAAPGGSGRKVLLAVPARPGPVAASIAPGVVSFRLPYSTRLGFLGLPIYSGLQIPDELDAGPAGKSSVPAVSLCTRGFPPPCRIRHQAAQCSTIMSRLAAQFSSSIGWASFDIRSPIFRRHSLRPLTLPARAPEL